MASSLVPNISFFLNTVTPSSRRFLGSTMISCEPLPPGFRFHPTDEELIIHYLQNQATSRPCPVPIIPELNIYKFDPWELPGKSDMCEGEWYFFSSRDRKYPNGSRPNRGTKSGYWKATGTDKAIHSGSRSVGIKKALVFYEGRPLRGSKTDWIMHEYRLSGAAAGRSCSTSGRTMRLDDWVLCRIYHKGISNQKKCSTGAIEQDTSADEHNNNNNYYCYYSSTPASEELQSSEPEEEEKKTPTPTPTPLLPRSCSIAHLLEGHHDYISVSQLFDDAPYCSIDDLFNSSSGSGRGDTSAADFHAGRSQSAVIGRSVFC